MDKEEFRKLDRSQRFTILFDVSEKELEARGINPDQYFAEHIGEVLKDPEKAKLELDPSNIAVRDYLHKLGRGYVLLFAGFGCLFLTFIPFPHSKIVGEVLASACEAVFWVVFVRAMMAKRVWKRACKAEGKKASLR